MKRCLILIFILAASVTVCGASRTDEWREDLQYLAKELPLKHPNAFHAVSRDDFQSAVTKLDKQIPDMTRNQILVSLMRIVSMIGDGHTSLSPLYEPSIGFHYFPVELYLYKDGLFVQKAAPEYKELAGARVLSIGNATVEQALQAVSTLIPHENDMGIRAFGPLYMDMPEVLHALGLTTDDESARFVFEINGKRVEKTLHSAGTIIPMHSGGPINTVGWNNASVGRTPLYLKERLNPYRYEFLPDSGTLYVQYNQVRDKDDEPVAAFCNRVFTFVESHDVEKFILDVRLNHGGNNYLNKPLLLGLIQSRKINQRGKLFVVIGRGTFSAAQNLVNEIEKYTNAIFVGESTAENVNFYGDHEPITLPHSKITVMVSTLWWQNMDPRDHRKATNPQIAVELTSDDYKNGIDPALETILKCKYDSVAESLTAGIKANDASLMRRSLLAFQKDPSHACVNIERDLNSEGYELLGKNQIQLAIEVFKLNAESYPASSNAHDSLGEAYLKAGQKALAVESYRKALALNPNNGHAKQILAELDRNL
jgi:tetratricopeptide (TPR) repeat protein